MGRWILRGILTVLVAWGALYLGDFAMWKGRGSPMGEIPVTRIVVAPLKGNKEEYYPDGMEQAPCSRSVFAQNANASCWWLSGHRQVEER